MITLAQKKPSLNWEEVFHPLIKPMINTAMPETSEIRMEPISMRRMAFFMVFHIRLYSGWGTTSITPWWSGRDKNCIEGKVRAQNPLLLAGRIPLPCCTRCWEVFQLTIIFDHKILLWNGSANSYDCGSTVMVPVKTSSTEH